MINRLIEKFGGINSMARALNIPPTTVQSWKNKNNIPNWIPQYYNYGQKK